MLASDTTKAIHCMTCEASPATHAMMEESSDITYDDNMDAGEETGTSGGGWRRCEFNEVAMSPSLEYFVQVSYAVDTQ